MSNFAKIGLFILSLSLLSACQKRPVKSFKVFSPNPESVRFKVSLDKKYSIPFFGSVKIRNNAGTIVFPKKRKGDSFDITMNIKKDLYTDPELRYLEPVTLLPTGAQFPSFIKSQVIELYHPVQSKIVSFFSYLGVEDERYLGFAVLISAIDEKFPEELSLNQEFKDKKGRTLVAASFFGPKLNDDRSVRVPGGFFIGTNLSHFFSGDDVIPASFSTEDLRMQYSVTGKNADRYNDAQSINEIDNKIVNALKDFGN